MSLELSVCPCCLLSQDKFSSRPFPRHIPCNVYSGKCCSIISYHSVFSIIYLFISKRDFCREDSTLCFFLKIVGRNYCAISRVEFETSRKFYSGEKMLIRERDLHKSCRIPEWNLHIITG